PCQEPTIAPRRRGPIMEETLRPREGSVSTSRRACRSGNRPRAHDSWPWARSRALDRRHPRPAWQRRNSLLALQRPALALRPVARLRARLTGAAGSVRWSGGATLQRLTVGRVPAGFEQEVRRLPLPGPSGRTVVTDPDGEHVLSFVFSELRRDLVFGADYVYVRPSWFVASKG